MSSFTERLQEGKPILWDGGMGTQLQARGLASGEAPEKYNLTHADVVSAIHRDYFSAGAEGVETNSFGANRITLERHGLQEDTREINICAARIARQAAPPGGLVAGSIGPTGKIPEPYGDCPLSLLYEAFAEQAAALRDGGVDFLLVETMIDLAELTEAVKACLQEGQLPVVGLMTFTGTKKGFRTVMGVSPAQAAERLIGLGACAVGSNCTNPIDEMIQVAREFRLVEATLPLVIMPNAGQPQVTGEKTVYLETPEKMGARIPELVEAGASVVGGCCGTTPEHIRRFREALGPPWRSEKAL